MEGNYKEMMNSTQELLDKKRGRLSYDEIMLLQEKIVIYGFLNMITEEGKYCLFDSGAFEDITKGYVSMIVSEMKLAYEDEPEKREALELIGADIIRASHLVLAKYDSKRAENYINDYLAEV